LAPGFDQSGVAVPQAHCPGRAWASDRRGRIEDQYQLRVGIVGRGYQGGLPAEAVASTDGLLVIASADPVRETAGAAALAVGQTCMPQRMSYSSTARWMPS
ncbi:MAG: hypothetical protein PVI07_03570, partial [Anaerolineae bacterium]